MPERSARSASPARKDFLFGISPDLPKVIELALDQIRPNPDQPRRTIDEAGIEELAASIETHGLLQPVTVRKAEDGKGYLLVAGERRFRAHQLLRRETIAAIATRGNPDELSLIENIQREDLSPLEEAAAMERMMSRHGYTQDALARVVGKARPTVTKLLKLNALPEVIKAECATSHISRSVLLEIAHLGSADEQLAFWEGLKGGGRTTVRAARETRAAGGPAPASPLARTVAAGRSFVQKMQRIPPHEAVADAAHYEELRRLRREIDAILEAYERAAPAD